MRSRRTGSLRCTKLINTRSGTTDISGERRRGRRSSRRGQLSEERGYRQEEYCMGGGVIVRCPVEQRELCGSGAARRGVGWSLKELRPRRTSRSALRTSPRA